MKRNEGGFTLIELMIAMLVLLIGVAGVLVMVRSTVVGARYTRHVTEASVLGEDKMEALRTMPALALADGTEQVDALGYAVDDALYTRSWTTAAVGDGTRDLVVTVVWDEDGEDRQVVLRARR
jgi:prepilin-type N-terminal cleavage/methylation domain-containing protein